MQIYFYRFIDWPHFETGHHTSILGHAHSLDGSRYML